MSTGSAERVEPATSSQSQDVEELVERYLPLVTSIAVELRRRLPSQFVLDDLISAGQEGLLQAARAYDPDIGATFKTFATFRIRGAMIDELRRQDPMGKFVRRQVKGMATATDQLISQLHRTPTEGEVAGSVNISRQQLTKLATYVETAKTEQYGERLEERVPSGSPTPEDLLVEREDQIALVQCVELLPPQSKQLVIAYFVDDKHYNDIAAEWGVTESRVSQVMGETLALLRLMMGLPAVKPPGLTKHHYAALASRATTSGASRRLDPEAAHLEHLVRCDPGPQP